MSLYVEKHEAGRFTQNQILTPGDRTCSTRIVCCFEPASSVP